MAIAGLILVFGARLALSQVRLVNDCIGVASGMPHPDVHHEALVKTADTALYQAKHAGRDRAAVESLSPPGGGG